MPITLYLRTYPVADAPVSVSFAPDGSARHTFTAAGHEYEAERREVRVDVPDGAKVDPLRNSLVWGNGKGVVRSTAKEVYDLAEAGASGFRMAE